MKLKRISADEISVDKKQFEKKEKFEKRITPHKNHKVFQFNTETRELAVAEFDNIPTIKWEDAVNENYTVYRKIIKKEGCIYFSALNVKNAKKVLHRDYNIEI